MLFWQISGVLDSHRWAILCTRGVLVVLVAPVWSKPLFFTLAWETTGCNVLFNLSNGSGTGFVLATRRVGNGSSRLTYKLLPRFKNTRCVLAADYTQRGVPLKESNGRGKGKGGLLFYLALCSEKGSITTFLAFFGKWMNVNLQCKKKRRKMFVFPWKKSSFGPVLYCVCVPTLGAFFISNCSYSLQIFPPLCIFLSPKFHRLVLVFF